MNIQYPKRDYELLVQTSKGNIFLKYKQSSAYGTIEFLNKDNEAQLTEITDLIIKGEFQYYVEKKWYRTGKRYYLECKTREMEILSEALDKQGVDIVKKISETLHKKYQSIFEGINIPNSSRKTLFSTNIMAICKEYNIPGPEVLLNDYTMEQVEWMADGMVLSFNEYTKEGKRTNDIAMSKVNSKKAGIDLVDNIKQFRESMQKK